MALAGCGPRYFGDVRPGPLDHPLGAGSARLNVEPSDGLVASPFTAVVTGVEPGSEVTIEAALEDEQTPAQRWTAVGVYRADARGRVDSAQSHSIGGTYSGVLPGGLACSGLPVAESEITAYLERLSQTPGRTSPLLGARDSFTVTVTARADGQQIGSTVIIRRFVMPEVAMSDVNEGNVVGLFFEPRRVTGMPVVVVSGSGGRAWREHAGMLASHGHPALALAMFNYPGLSPTLDELPIEAVGDATRWLSEQTGAPRVAIIGVSRGTEAVQLAAAHFPQHVAGIVLLVPSPLVHGGLGPGGGTNRPAWTLHGRPVPFVQLTARATNEERERAGRSPPGHSDLAAFMTEWINPESYARWATPLERINVPILAIGGAQDAAWPSGFGANRIRERMEALGKGHLVEVHVYPEAGHNISRPGIANRISASSIHSVSRLWLPTGGVAEANCAAGYDSWSRTLSFLDRLGLQR